MDSNKNDDIPSVLADKIGRVEIEESTSSPNVRPSIPFDQTITGPLFAPKEPIIERLAEAARPKPEQPTAGAYAIEHVNLDHLTNFPPESLLLDDRPIFNLGKAPVDAEYPLSHNLTHVEPKQSAKKPESARVDSKILKDLQAIRDLNRDQVAILTIKRKSSSTSGTSSNNNGNVEEKVEKSDKQKSKRRFSVSGFFKRRSTTK